MEIPTRRMEKLSSALDTATASSLLESCSEEEFLSLFSKSSSLSDYQRRQLSALRNHMFKSVMLNVQKEFQVIMGEYDLEEKLISLDNAYETIKAFSPGLPESKPVHLQPLASCPDQVTSRLRIDYKLEARDLLKRQLQNATAQLDTTDKYYQSVRNQIDATAQNLMNSLDAVKNIYDSLPTV